MDVACNVTAVVVVAGASLLAVRQGLVPCLVGSRRLAVYRIHLQPVRHQHRPLLGHQSTGPVPDPHVVQTCSTAYHRRMDSVVRHLLSAADRRLERSRTVDGGQLLQNARRL